MNKFLAGAIVLSILILLTGQGCRYSDYIKNVFSQEKEGKICVQTAQGVICGTPEEIAKQTEEKIGEEKELEEKEPEEIEEKPEEAVGYLPEKVVTEGDLVSFPNLRAVDPDGDQITYRFGKPLNEKGEWQTKTGDAGEHIATIYATDSKSEISQDIKITVKKFNHPPELEKIPDITVKEGEVIRLGPKATDPDGDKITFSYSGYMDSAEKEAGFGDAGTRIVKVTASDGEKTATQDVKIIVENVDRAPILEPIEDISVVEKDLIRVEPKATDPDGDSVSFTFSKPLDERGEWQTKQGDQGNYEVTITAGDGELADTKKVKIFIDYFDKPPIFEKMEDITVNEEGMIILKPLAFDPEREELTYTYSGFMKQETYKTTFEDAGEYEETITVSDGVNRVSQTIKIKIKDVNRPPVFAEGAFE